MTLGTLIQSCQNIAGNTEIMIYHSLEDFEMCTSRWNSCRAESVRTSEMIVVKFHVINPNLVAVAIA